MFTKKPKQTIIKKLIKFTIEFTHNYLPQINLITFQTKINGTATANNTQALETVVKNNSCQPVSGTAPYIALCKISNIL